MNISFRLGRKLFGMLPALNLIEFPNACRYVAAI
jgi:hypothetical protein